ncbi:MAG: MMPL family transporter [Acidobacteria bacterium]|nr:MMPL family transporter [Acidobacteriota bacterium]
MAPGHPTTTLFGRLGAWCARRRWWVLGAWVVALVGLTIAGSALGGRPSDNLSVPGLAAAEGAAVLQRAFPGQGLAEGQVVMRSEDGSLLRGPSRAAIAQSARALRAVPGVASVSPPGPAGTVSPDGRTALMGLEWSTPPQDLGPAQLDRVRAAARPLEQAGLVVAYAGAPAAQAEATGTDWSAVVGIVAAIVILLLAFGSVVTMAIPVVGALVSVGTALAVLAVLQAVTDVSDVGRTLAVMIGLGVSVDYALFVVTRHAQQVAQGVPVRESVARATATAGRAVVIAGGTVAVAVLGLAAAGIPFVTRLGQSAAIAVVIAVLAAITLLPAALAIAGSGLGRWRLPFVSGPRPVDLDAPPGKMHGWARWSLMVTRKPWPFLVGGLAVLLLLAAPVLRMELGQVDAGSDPPGSTTREAYHLISTGFGPGFNGPVQVVLEGPNAKRSAQAVAQRARDLAGVVAASAPVESPIADVALVNVVPAAGPASPRTSAMVEKLAQRLRPVAGPGTRVYATGLTAVGVDLSDRVASRLPWFIGAVILISFVLLMFEFRSLLVPLQAAVMNLLSVAAAFGVVVAIFQWGILRDQIGVPEAVAIEAWVPMMMFAILFGLSMDYEVFLLSRVREGWLDSGDPHRSVALGLASTARVITAAALIMVSVFMAFVLNDSVVVKMLGIGLATAVLVDATIIRLMLVPAVLSLCGRWNWWLPGRRGRDGGAAGTIPS